MSTPSERDLQATVTRYSVAKLQRVSILIPLGLVASTLTRRLPGTLTFGFALCVMFVFFLVLRDAIKRLGTQTVRVDGDEVSIGSEHCRLSRDTVRMWTFFRGVATLSSHGTTYRLRSKRTQDSELEDLLRSVLGAPTRLERRGSLKARMIAGGSMISGIAAVVSGVAFDLVPMFVIGILSALIGFGAFAALSSRRVVGG